MANAYLNPINFLQEFCQKYCKTSFPKYFEASSTFESQKQLHFCKCNFVEFTAIQVSTTKKKVKFLAARAIVNLLKYKQYFDKYGCFINRNGDVEFTDELDHGLGSPISSLQEYCQGLRLDLPMYIERTKRSELKEFIFECICVGKFTTGNGTSKKSAKRRAAANMCDFLSVEYEKKEPSEKKTKNKGAPLRKNLDTVKVLDSICENNGLSKPSYSCLILTNDNTTSYQMFCKCTDIEGSGTDTSKKRAQKLAASKALEILIQEGFATEVLNHVSEVIDEWNEAPKFALKALCFCLKLTPNYNVTKRGRKKRKFIVVCKVNNFEGTGNSKVEDSARLIADREVYEKLLLNNFDVANISASSNPTESSSQSSTVLMNDASQQNINLRVLKEFILPFTSEQASILMGELRLSSPGQIKSTRIQLLGE